MQLSQRITSARKTKGLTQEELADMAGVTTRTIQRIESGETQPRAFTIKALAEALGLPFENLQDSEETVQPLADAPGTKHFLDLLVLSCFSYLVIPFVHFLVPLFMLKKRKDLPPYAFSFARRVVNAQLYWLVAMNACFFMILAWNLLVARYNKTMHVSYLIPFFVAYLANALVILRYLVRVRRLPFENA